MRKTFQKSVSHLYINPFHQVHQERAKLTNCRKKKGWDQPLSEATDPFAVPAGKQNVPSFKETLFIKDEHQQKLARNLRLLNS